MPITTPVYEDWATSGLLAPPVTPNGRASPPPREAQMVRSSQHRQQLLQQHPSPPHHLGASPPPQPSPPNKSSSRGALPQTASPRRVTMIKPTAVKPGQARQAKAASPPHSAPADGAWSQRMAFLNRLVKVLDSPELAQERLHEVLEGPRPWLRPLTSPSLGSQREL